MRFRSQTDPDNQSGANSFLSSMSYSTSMTPMQLASQLQAIVDRLIDLQPHWEGDHRVTELVDTRRLTDLTHYLCAERNSGYEF
jgi:hypothetical protein